MGRMGAKQGLLYKTTAGSTNSQQLWLPARSQLQPLAEKSLTDDDLGEGC